jgi:hypothetical protein
MEITAKRLGAIILSQREALHPIRFADADELAGNVSDHRESASIGSSVTMPGGGLR